METKQQFLDRHRQEAIERRKEIEGYREKIDRDVYFRLTAYFKWWLRYITGAIAFFSIFGAGIYIYTIAIEKADGLYVIVIPPIALVLGAYIGFFRIPVSKCLVCSKSRVNGKWFYCGYCYMSYINYHIGKHIYLDRSSKWHKWD